jgi:RNA polymerase binding protein RbpA
MPRGTLRGYRGGHTTVEPDRHTELAARVTARFSCTRGHEFTVYFALEAELPARWTCRRHGVEGCGRIDA